MTDNIVGGKRAECGCIVRFVGGHCQKIKCSAHLAMDRAARIELEVDEMQTARERYPKTYFQGRNK